MVHGIRLHTRTFEYFSRQNHREAQLRNFVVRPDIAATVAWSDQKAESYRLGYEMSEDALSWNVFVSFAEAGKLRRAAEFLIGHDVGGEPELYLWGELVDAKAAAHRRYQPLVDTIGRLENDITRFRTEPDIMLVVDGRTVICIEAKFGSGNPLARDGTTKDGEKPTDRKGLLGRYLDPAKSEKAARAIDPDGINEKIFHSQLFRNVVFASEMASGGDWHVVNLVSETQWKLKRSRTKDRHPFEDPREYVRSYLRAECEGRFHFHTWEELYRGLVRTTEGLAPLEAYMRTKSAHYELAFDLR
jgi:hypothetical protein